MKTDPRAYSWTLTEELAETAGTQGLDAHDLYIYVCGLQKAARKTAPRILWNWLIRIT